MLNDLRYALRLLRRSPGFTAVAVLTLALGIGVNTAVFSLVDAALWRPLPYHDAERLVEILRMENAGTPRQASFHGLTLADARIWGDQRHVFEDAEQCTDAMRVVLAGQEDQEFFLASMAPDFATFLGVPPRLGRLFVPDEATPGRDDVIVISERFWHRAFGGSDGALGKSVTLDGRPYTVVGVMPDLFRFPNKMVDAWKPFTGARDPENSGARFALAIARLRPGLSLQNAQRQLDEVSARLEHETPRRMGWRVVIQPLAGSPQTGTVQAMYALMGAVGFVLLLACVNVVNMLLARDLGRARELAIRSALGAGRWRLVRQSLVESGVLVVVGGSLAAIGAMWAAPLLSLNLPRGLRWLLLVHDSSVDTRTLTFALVASTLAVLACGLVPAARASRRQQLAEALTGAATSGAPPRRWLRTALAAAEIALTLVLLVGTGLLIRSFIQHTRIDPGFDTDGLLVIDVMLPPRLYLVKSQQDGFYDDLRAMAGQLPRVRAATVALGVPPHIGFAGTFEPEGARVQGRLPSASISYVQPDYFGTLGIPLLEGRHLSAEDTPTSPPVALVDRDAARRFWPGQSAVGKRFRSSPNAPWTTVVGVVGSAVTGDYALAPESFGVYRPLSQQETASARSLVLRTTGDVSAALTAIRNRISERASPRALQRIGTVEERYDDLLETPRFFVATIGLFAVMALGLAAVGLYGVLAYSVSQRTREIGVRMALGAAPSEVKGMVLTEASASFLVGTASGLGVAWWLTSFLKTMLFGVTPHDPWALAAACLVLGIVVLAASYIPASRASRVDPMVALRHE